MNIPIIGSKIFRRPAEFVGSRHLTSRGKNMLASYLAESCKTAYAERIVKAKNGKEGTVAE